MRFLDRIFGRRKKKYQGFFDDESNDSGFHRQPPSSLPPYWESLRSFSIVIPFSEKHLQMLTRTLEEAAKFRTALLQLCRTSYFHDPLYEQMMNEKETSGDHSARLEEYINGCTNELQSKVVEKIGLILLFESTGQELSPGQQRELAELANNCQACNVIDFTGDRLVRNPRSAVLRYASGGRILIIEPRRQFSDAEVNELLSDMLGGKGHKAAERGLAG